MNPLTEDDFYTILNSGEEIPVRRVGDSYIVTYGLMDKDEFASWANKLLEDLGEQPTYDKDDVYFGAVSIIDFDDDTPRIKFGYDSSAIDITYVEIW